MLNIIIPMAGAGSRFANAGYTFPKPLIEVKSKPMIQVVTENLKPKNRIDYKFTYIVQKEHYQKYALQYLLNLISPWCNIVIIDSLTKGAACTVLLASEYIDNTDELLIANSDQFVAWWIDDFLSYATNSWSHGTIMSFKSTHPKWSFARIDEHGDVEEVAEKKPISDNATVWIYYFREWSCFIKGAQDMIQKNIMTNGEFYVCPVYNEMILKGSKVKIYDIADRMWGIWTPEDLNRFLDSDLSKDI